MDQQESSYILLARIEAAVSTLVAAIIVILYFLLPNQLPNPQASIILAAIGTITGLYYISAHQLLNKKHLAASTLIISIISACNILVLIIQTGGLNSPFYALWLLAIVAAGLFSGWATISILGVTTLYYVYSIISNGITSPYAKDHVIQLGLSIVAGCLAEWVHTKNRHAQNQTSKVAAISGQLSEESLKAQVLMSSIGEGVLVVDNSRKIQLFNKSAQTMTGWEESNAQGIDYRLILKLKDENDADITDENDPILKASREHASTVTRSLTITTEGGRKLAVNLSVSPIYDNNQAITGAIILFRDITSEKDVERQKDEFISTASHEMRTPVAAIEGYLSLALNANSAMVDERAAKYLNKAHDAVIHLGDLFKDLLTVTQAEEGSLTENQNAVDLTGLVKSAVDDMQFAAQNKALSLVYQTNSQGAAKSIAPIYYIKANPERLREVVMNLIDNAIKYTSKGGITVTLTGDDKEATVSITDTGIGIASEDAAHLFQKFYRIDSSATRTIGGTGLGLYLCRTVIELFGGKIWVESKIGQGSSFKFSLPRISMNDVAALRKSNEEFAKVQAIKDKTAASKAGAAMPLNVSFPSTSFAAPSVDSIKASLTPSPQPSISGMAETNSELTKNPAAAIAAALAAHPVGE